MTPLNLIQSLKEMILQDLSTFRLQSERESKKIGVYLHLANENFTHEDLYPLILISLLKVEDLSLESTRPSMSIATVELTIGVFGEDSETYVDLLNICEHLRQKLLRDQLIANKFRLQLPIQTEILADQPYPYQFAYLKTQYSIWRRF